MRSRVLYFCISAQLGGAEQSLLSMVIKNKDQQDVKFLFPVESGPLIDKLKKEGFLVDTLKMPNGLLKSSRRKFVLSASHFFLTWPLALTYFYTLQTYLRRSNFDIVHCTGLKCHVLAAIACLNSKTQVLFHVRDVFQSKTVARVLKAFLQLPNVHAIYNSQASAAPLQENGLIIYNGFELQGLQNTSPSKVLMNSDSKDDEQVDFDIRTELCLSKEKKLIAHVGVFADWKGQDIFLKVAQKLITENKDLHFLLVGDEIYDTEGEKGIRSSLRALVKKLDLTEHVSFLGFRNDVHSILKCCDLFCHTSKKPEPFGRVLIEAMIAQVPVVAAKAGGVLEIIEHEKNGLLCEPKNIEQYKTALDRLLQDEVLKQHLIDNALTTVKEKFSIDSHCEQINKLYASMIPDCKIDERIVNQ